MVGLLVLFHGDLNKLGLKLAHPFPYLLQVFLHSFPFAFEVIVHLARDHLRVVVHNHTHGPCGFGEIQSYH